MTSRISPQSLSTYSGISDSNRFEVYETNEQYAQRVGQNGMDMYIEQSAAFGVPMIFCSLSATSVARAAFLGKVIYWLVSVFLTLVLLIPAESISVATFDGRTPVSIPHDGRYSSSEPSAPITAPPTASFEQRSSVIVPSCSCSFSASAERSPSTARADAE